MHVLVTPCLCSGQHVGRQQHVQFARRGVSGWAVGRTAAPDEARSAAGNCSRGGGGKVVAASRGARLARRGARRSGVRPSVATCRAVCGAHHTGPTPRQLQRPTRAPTWRGHDCRHACHRRSYVSLLAVDPFYDVRRRRQPARADGAQRETKGKVGAKVHSTTEQGLTFYFTTNTPATSRTCPTSAPWFACRLRGARRAPSPCLQPEAHIQS